jgi:hypothetical protein
VAAATGQQKQKSEKERERERERERDREREEEITDVIRPNPAVITGYDERKQMDMLIDLSTPEMT